MRINEQNKTMDMESRDLNYILPAYLRSYQFHSKNELPTKIIFPMFPSVKAANGVDIPIEYVPPLDAIAAEISKDGSNVAEVTPEQEAVLDEKDDEIARLKADMEKLQTSIIQQKGTTLSPEEVESLTTTGRGEEERGSASESESNESPARAAFGNPELSPKSDPMPSDRKPKQPPGGDIGAGQHLSDNQPRQQGDQTRTARDLLDEPDTDEAKEKEFEKEITRGEDGKPVVEDKPDASSG